MRNLVTVIGLIAVLIGWGITLRNDLAMHEDPPLVALNPPFQGVLYIALPPDIATKMYADSPTLQLEGEGGDPVSVTAWQLTDRTVKLEGFEGLRPALYSILIIEWPDRTITRHPIRINLVDRRL